MLLIPMNKLSAYSFFYLYHMPYIAVIKSPTNTYVKIVVAIVLEIFKTAKLFLENRKRKLNSNDKYNKTFNIKIIDCIVF